MKANKRTVMINIIVPALVVISASIHAGDTGLSREGANAYNFCSQQNIQSKVNISIDFSRHHSFEFEARNQSSNPLFVGAAFKVNRPIETFNIAKLTNPRDVSILSESKLTNIKKWSNKLEFTSSKRVGFKTLVCENEVINYTWNEFIAHEIFSAITDVLESEGCFKYQRPSVVTVQKVSKCNSYFNKTRLVTFYSESRDGGTNILSLSLNSLLNRPNGLMRGLMTNEIEKSLKKLPSFIEKLQ